MDVILYLRDVLTFVVIGGFMLWCATHQFVDYVRSLYNEQPDQQLLINATPKPKFNGSASTWVK